MRGGIRTFVKFLVFVVLLNLARYLLGGPLEKLLLLDKLFGAMERSSSCFNTQFSTFDWTTSFFYNFMVWFTCAVVFWKMQASLRGNYICEESPGLAA